MPLSKWSWLLRLTRNRWSGCQESLESRQLGFFHRFGCWGLILAEYYAQFPDGSLPTGIYGCFGGQQILKGFVGICPELQCIHQGSKTSSPLERLLLPQHSPEMRCLLAEGHSGFWSGVMGTATGVGLLGDKSLDLQLDVSSTSWDRRFLTSIVMLPSDFRGDL